MGECVVFLEIEQRSLNEAMQNCLNKAPNFYLRKLGAFFWKRTLGLDASKLLVVAEKRFIEK